MESTIEVVGYVACCLVLATFYVKKILTLRLVAICSNVAFILYALGSTLYPIFILHSISTCLSYLISSCARCSKTSPNLS